MKSTNLPTFDIPEYNLTLDFNKPFREVLLTIERAYFLTVLRFVNHSVVGLSRHAGLERTHLYRKVRSLGIDMESYREASRLGLDKDPLVFTHGPQAPRKSLRTLRTARTRWFKRAVRYRIRNCFTRLRVQRLIRNPRPDPPFQDRPPDGGWQARLP